MKTLEYLKVVVKHELIAIKEALIELKLIVLLLVLIFAGLIYYLKPFPEKSITISTAFKGSDWYQFAETIAPALQDHDISLTVLASDGSIENVEKLDNQNSKVTAGLTYGAALSAEQIGGIYSLGSITYEPIWIFYHEKRIGKITDIKDFARFKVGVGPPKSGSYAFAEKLFAINGIQIKENKNFQAASIEGNLNQFLDDKLDVFIFVSTIIDLPVQKLIRSPGIKLFNFKNSAAYEKKFYFLDAVEIPAGSINILNNFPPENISLIATTSTLAVRRDMHPDLQLALLIAMKNTIQDSQLLFFAKRNQFPAYVDPSIPLSPVARKFYNNGPPQAIIYLPYWLGVFVDRFWLILLTLFAVIYPLSKLNFHLRKFLYAVKERGHYEEILAIDRQVSSDPISAEQRVLFLKRLDEINLLLIRRDVPIGEETDYYLFVNATQLLRNKIERL
ncbi:hypothetical protein LZG75_07820 [Polynucleobacter sp. IMCC30063]|uniref:TAXI family TRAP transporter solute-binding subunit n=1 Tax=unclassified Polynucleobacter TaxID=2640945 RepID=UPI001F41EAAE|nr:MULTISPECIES: TAXI family TRAP transporter solute-binding subunit [unclassified Polynucleobacter]MCE7506149.1 hypothetical protein [Polynucleobacter sp. IMCC30063]MCE7527314.1 hypothetical protein [Polynucleobacter sp. IMCC 30228]MCE7528822.1 hypothetical protein [Polynucleobacter sp. IMCC 29146]